MSGDFDKAIDRAVHEMLDVEQPAGFRHRVLRRIEGRDSKSPAAFRKMLWIALPAAAAAILLLAILLPRRAEQRSPQPQTTTVRTQPEPVTPRGQLPQVKAPRTAEKTPVQKTEPAPLPRRTPPPDRMVAAAVAPEDTTFAVAPLGTPPTLSVPEISTPVAAQLPSAGPQPMQIRALEVSALPETPRERREE